MKSNFITDTFLFGNVYKQFPDGDSKDSEEDTLTETSDTPPPSLQGSWRTRVGSTEPPENSTIKSPWPPKTSSTAKTHPVSHNKLDKLNQTIVDVKRARARDTISNALSKHQEAHNPVRVASTNLFRIEDAGFRSFSRNQIYFGKY